MANVTTDPIGACPKCGGTFESLQLGQYTVERCQACEGLWLDERELGHILEIDHAVLRQTHAAQSTSPLPTGKKGPCPRCSGSLITLHNLQANVMTDSCSVCFGVFLDAGELEAFEHPTLTARVGHALRRLFGRKF